MIDRRTSERIKAGYAIEVMYDSRQYTGVLENLSAAGANVLTDPIDHDIEFLDGETIEIRFKAHTGKSVLLTGQVIWSSKIPPMNTRHRIGVKIIDLPLDKFDFSL